MRHRVRIRISAAAIITLIWANPLAAQSVDRPRYSLKSLTMDVGAMYRQTLVVGGALPFESPYDSLSPEQKGLVKSQYVGLTERDEPPYPEKGLAQIYRAVFAGQQKRQASGPMSVLVEVDQDGVATSAAIHQTPDPELGSFVAAVLMQQKYKPGLCDGRPCAMVFPFRVQFSVR